MSLEILGFTQLHAKLKALGEEIETKVARSATSAAAKHIRALAYGKAKVSDSALTPAVPPGFTLRENIITRYIRPAESGVSSMHVVTVRKKNNKFPTVSPYRVGVFNEFGTVKLSPHPFMRPAFAQGKSDAVEIIRKTLQDKIKQAERSR